MFVMRLERLSNNKLKISVPRNDLLERGLTIDDVWFDSLKWQQLFDDMLEKASDQFDVEIEDPITIEIFTLQSEGIVMIATLHEDEDEDFSKVEQFTPLSIKFEQSKSLLFKFASFEHIIQLAHQLFSLNFCGGKLFYMETNYYLYFSNEETPLLMNYTPLITEYGDESTISIVKLQEYGNEIIGNNALQIIVTYFK